MCKSVRDRAGTLLLAVLAWTGPGRAWAQPAPPEGTPAAAPDTGAAPAPDATAPVEPALPPPTAPEPPPPPAKRLKMPVPPVPPALQSVGQPEDAAVVEPPAPQPVSRPRLSAAVGMGSSFDSVGFDDGNTRAIPSFFTVLGIGDGPLGLDLVAFASQAAGRHGTQNPVDRLAVDLFGVIRPGSWVRRDDRSYPARVLHGLGAELGLGFERDGRSAVSGTRFIVHTGLRADFPLTPAREATEVRLRLAARRGFGLYTPKLYGNTVSDVVEVGDSAVELYGALVVVF